MIPSKMTSDTASVSTIRLLVFFIVLEGEFWCHNWMEAHNSNNRLKGRLLIALKRRLVVPEAEILELDKTSSESLLKK